MTIELLPPGRKDKLRAHCRLFRHEWTNEWTLPTHNMYGREIIRYKLCLRCSEYRYRDPLAEAKAQARKFIYNVYGLTPVHINCKSAL